MILSVINNKGGSSKTTTVTNLAYELSLNHSVLVIDLDPQKNSTSWLQVYDAPKTIGDVIRSDCELSEAIQATGRLNISCVSSDVHLIQIEKEISADPTLASPARLYEEIKKVETDFDFIIIDTNPTFNTLITHAMISADLIIIPARTSKNNIEGVLVTIAEAKEIKEIFNRPLDYRILVTQKSKNNQSDETLDEIRNAFGDKLFETVIRFQSSPVERAEAEYKAINELMKPGKVGKEYRDLAREITEMRNQ